MATTELSKPTRRGFLTPRRFMDLLEFPEDYFPFSVLHDEDIRVDEFRQNGHLVIKAEAPGINPAQDVQLEIRDGRLYLDVERRRESKVEEKHLVREEIRYGHFSRSLPLPAGCTEKDVKASYHDGILEVQVPIPREVTGRHIPITTTTT